MISTTHLFRGQYVWTTTNPHAHDAWSDGVSFYFPGYDTSLFWDEHDGDRVYVQGSTYWRVRPHLLL